MREWPEPFAIENCIAWNEAAKSLALRDASNGTIVVPPNATKRVYEDGRAKQVRLTQSEYRDQRWADADRYERNIASLSERIANA